LKSYVLDASVAGAWLFEEQQSKSAIKFRNQALVSMAIIPQLFRYEIANLILNNTRKNVTKAREVAFKFIESIPVMVDFKTPMYLDLVELASDAQLTVYDSIYLELAIRYEVPLATYDKKLARAAIKMGIEILG
jgi:predicted nucleic acid-binding protein